MVSKVPSPFASPFSKTILGIFWLAYPALLAAAIVSRDPSVLFIAVGWTLWLPWITWSFLSGVKVEPGRSVGGGPLYPRITLNPDEQLIFQSPVFGGHLFVTDQRVLISAIRFSLVGTGTRAVRLRDIVAVEQSARGFGWPIPKQSVRLTLSSGSLLIRPSGNGFGGKKLATFMGMVMPNEFMDGFINALEARGVPVRRQRDQLS